MEKLSLDTDSLEMVVAGLIVDPDTNSPIVILRDPKSEKALPIWIGFSEASSIAVALKEMEVSRPLTHDLMKSMLDRLGAKIHSVCITDLQDGTFISTIELTHGDALMYQDARPSDAIGLALRYGLPILVKEEVIEQAQSTVTIDKLKNVHIVPKNSHASKQAEVADTSLDASGSSMSKETEIEITSHKSSSDSSSHFPVFGSPGDLSSDEWNDLLKNMLPDDFKYKM